MSYQKEVITEYEWNLSIIRVHHFKFIILNINKLQNLHYCNKAYDLIRQTSWFAVCISFFTLLSSLVPSTAAHNSSLGMVLSSIGVTFDLAQNSLIVTVLSGRMSRKYTAAPYSRVDASENTCNENILYKFPLNTCLGIWMLLRSRRPLLKSFHCFCKWCGMEASQSKFSFHNCWINILAITVTGAINRKQSNILPTSDVTFLLVFGICEDGFALI